MVAFQVAKFNAFTGRTSYKAKTKGAYCAL